MLMQPKGESDCPVRGLVRHTKMSQLGHFMMGKVRVKGISLSVSGSYGSDGLIMDVPKEVYNMGMDLPDELYKAWAHGDGHNGAGYEAKQMCKWALENLKALRNK